MTTDAKQCYWLSTQNMTVFAEIDANGKITNASPIVRRFVGQAFLNLKRWLERQGGLRCEKIL